MVNQRARRRGVSSVLAMTYLVLFAVLAIGFFAQVNSSVQVANNETRSRRAMLAAESGLAFARYHLNYIKIPALTPDGSLIDEICKDLKTRLDGSGNLKYGQVGYVTNTSIHIPAGTNDYVDLEPGGGGDKFQIRITLKPGTRRIVVRIIGASPINPGGATVTYNRAGIECEFDTKEHKATFFNYGIASKGAVNITPSNRVVSGNPAEMASILGMGTVTIGMATNTQPSGITGEITMVGTGNPTLVGPVTVDGTTDKNEILASHSDPADDHVHHIEMEDAPEFPTPDTNMFKPYATEVYVSGKAVYDNIIIPPNTNPTINGPTKVRGVVYVQQPNIVTFAGQVEMQCVVVTEDQNVGTLSTNQILLQGNGGSKLPLADLPVVLDADGNDKFEVVRTLTGAFIIAPGFDVALSGNFGAITGDICGDRVTVTGNSAATINGALYTLEPNPLRIGGAAQLTLGVNPYQDRAGLKFSERYVPTPDTYREFIPN